MCLLIVFTLSFAIVIHLIWIYNPSIAQERTIISGRIIDTTGNPISDITMYLRPYSGPYRENSSSSGNDVQIHTDAKGRFAFSDIQHKALQLDINSDLKTGYQINVLSAEFGEIALYPDRGWSWSSIEFALDSGTRMEDIIITADIRKRSKIRTRVIYADETPLSNTQLYVVYRETKLFVGNDKGSGRLIKKTDADGYFVEYLHGADFPTHFITLAVEHQNLYAKAIPFIKKDNTELVLKLNGTPALQTAPSLEHSARFAALETYLEPPPVWIVNPANGHVYKITHSQPIKNAMEQAKNEGAYLVAINDENEQKWLNYVFGNGWFWIGLSDAEEEGKWKWQNGEPLNYTNWAPYQQQSGNSETKDYVITGNFDWEWMAYEDIYDVGNTQKISRFARAILEKGNTSSKIVPDKN